MIMIKSIEFIEDDFYGNKIFDFTLNGKPASTIVLAGENGVGKTRLLHFIYAVFNQNIQVIRNDINTVFAKITIDIKSAKLYYKSKIVDTAVVICKKYQNSFLYEAQLYCDESLVPRVYKDSDDNEVMYGLNLKSLLSPVDITYSPTKQINTVSNKELDQEDTSLPNDLASDIIQLLVDITSQDNNDIARYVNEHPDTITPNSIKNIRMNRFNKAFYRIFNNSLRYDGIQRNTIPMFKKNHKEIKINDLSSGEKQIVFRGAYLLKNQESLNGIPVLIDEPEISMHPKWNNRIYEFYRRLFKTDNGIETSQMFMATHSEYVIESALDDVNCIIVKLDESLPEKYSSSISNGFMNKMSYAEIRYRIFDITTIDFHIQLYSFIQNNCGNNLKTIKKVDEYLVNNGSPMKKYSYINEKKKKIEYNSLCTYIRNCIDHPDSEHGYTKKEFEESVTFMLKHIKNESK